MKERSCMFTGHRDIPETVLAPLTAWLDETVRALIAAGVTHFIAGGARGFDTLAAEAVLRARTPNVTLEIAIPCPNQTRGWSASDVGRHEAVLAACDRQTVLAERYYRGCMQARNRYMADGADICVCYLTKDTGGTAYTVRYAARKGLKIISYQDTAKKGA